MLLAVPRVSKEDELPTAMLGAPVIARQEGAPVFHVKEDARGIG